ncbi:MAG: hypothetical protein SH868_07230 [Bythopirellula sp.]|nr:hypothetical protein [Bythopirellula sp.]
MLFTKTLPCRTEEEWLAALPAIRDTRYAVIETCGGELQAIHLRRFPKLISWPEIWPVASGYHAQGATDRCLLYYNQPRSCLNFLALKYVVSSPRTSYATLLAAVGTLDAIGAAKQIDAILCDAANSRLSDRLLVRHGWEKHKPARWHRNFIKRFYGEYPAIRLPLLARPSAS